MPWYTRFALGLVACLASISTVEGQEPPTAKKAKVELRWVEFQRIEGLTEDKGIRVTCDPTCLAYPLKKPALVVTAAEVAEARLTKHDFSGSGGPAELYTVTLHLTKEARSKLAATCDTLESRGLTFVVDGIFWGVHRYEKDKAKMLIPDESRADTFTPSIGFITSKAEAQRLMDTFK